MRKNGQITIFMLVAVALVLMFGALYIFFGSGQEETLEVETQKTQEQEYIKNEISTYVTQCVQQSLKKGLRLITQQGGYIFEDQGGTIKRGGRNAPLSKQNASYLITRIKLFGIDDDAIGVIPPKYPCTTRDPSPCLFDARMNSEGYFGTSELMPLTKKRDFRNKSIQLQLEKYVETKTLECVNLTNYAYEVRAGQINASISINEEDVVAKVDYPMTIITPINRTTEIISYTTVEKVRLNRIYELVKYMVEQDVSDITYDIVYDSYNSPKWVEGLKIEKFENIEGTSDDMLVVNDTLSKINQEPVYFRFMRENRWPALNHLMAITATESNTLVAIAPVANDPDEDEIVYSYKGFLSAYLMNSPIYLSKGRKASVNVTGMDDESNTTEVRASDGSLADYQGLRVTLQGVKVVAIQ